MWRRQPGAAPSCCKGHLSLNTAFSAPWCEVHPLYVQGFQQHVNTASEYVQVLSSQKPIERGNTDDCYEQCSNRSRCRFRQPPGCCHYAIGFVQDRHQQPGTTPAPPPTRHQRKRRQTTTNPLSFKQFSCLKPSASCPGSCIHLLHAKYRKRTIVNTGTS
jgi:hypothetical protein